MPGPRFVTKAESEHARRELKKKGERPAEVRTRKIEGGGESATPAEVFCDPGACATAGPSSGAPPERGPTKDPDVTTVDKDDTGVPDVFGLNPAPPADVLGIGGGNLPDFTSI